MCSIHHLLYRLSPISVNEIFTHPMARSMVRQSLQWVAGPAPRFPLFSAGGSPWGTSPHRPTPAPVGYFSLSRCPRFCFFISEWDTQCYATYSQIKKISHFSLNAILQNGKKGKKQKLAKKTFSLCKKDCLLAIRPSVSQKPSHLSKLANTMRQEQKTNWVTRLANGNQ